MTTDRRSEVQALAWFVVARSRDGEEAAAVPIPPDAAMRVGSGHLTIGRVRRGGLLVVLCLIVFSGLAGSSSGALSAAGPLGSKTASSAYYYYCSAGLVQTQTSDSQANGRYCSFWLLKSFPLGGAQDPQLNESTVPGLDVLPVWQRTRGAGVKVAVVDTGVDTSSPDLAPNLLPGWNYYNGNSDLSDRAGHGTVIASIIGSAAGNGGYVGIAPEAKIMPIKVMGGDSGEDWSDAAVVRGIEAAVQRKARVINLSLGGLNTPIPGVDKALRDAQRAGSLVVIAAGNDGVDLDNGKNVESPDGYGLPNTLTVANFTNRNTLADDSNYGARHVQIASLGAVLWGDYPGNANGGYLGGSSAAAATVSGVAALLFAADPQATAAEVRRAIIVGANHNAPGLEGKVEANGLLDASGALAALAHPDTTPPQPFGARTSSSFQTRTSGVTTLAWSASIDPELEGYQVTIDGRTTTLAPSAASFSAALKPGLHRWSVAAFDLSGNRTTARSKA
jgi:thermitase